jgi:hypothetical protein
MGKDSGPAQRTPAAPAITPGPARPTTRTATGTGIGAASTPSASPASAPTAPSLRDLLREDLWRRLWPGKASRRPASFPSLAAHRERRPADANQAEAPGTGPGTRHTRQDPQPG